MLETIMNYIAIWGPSIASIFTAIGAIMCCISKMNKAASNTEAAIREFAQSNTVKQLIDENSELRNTIKEQAAQNAEIVRTNKIVIDELTKIKDYADTIKGEK